MFFTYVVDYWKSVAELFIEMAPYLLLGMTIAGILYVAISKRFVARHIGGHSFLSVVKAAVFGVPLPLCSCGVLPTSVYLKDSGASKPAVLSFLIATPQTGVDSIIATYGMLGPFFAFFKALSALVLGAIGGAVGLITGKREHTEERANQDTGVDSREMSLAERAKTMVNYAYVEFVDSIALRFVIGLLIAGLITLVIPDDFFAETSFASGLPGMLLMIAIGTPLFVCSTSSLPIAVALVAKGFSPGAAFVFLIAGPATNAATIAILWRVLGKKTLATYLGTIMVGAVGMGFLLNLLLLQWQGLTPALFAENLQYIHDDVFGDHWTSYILPAVFFALLLFSFLKKTGLFKMRGGEEAACDIVQRDEESQNNLQKIETKEIDMGKLRVKVSGMTCEHCVENVKSSISRIEGVDKVSVSLKKQTAEVKGDVTLEEVKDAVEAVGYKVKE